MATMSIQNETVGEYFRRNRRVIPDLELIIRVIDDWFVSITILLY